MKRRSDRLLRRHAAALGFEREVDLHDRVLLDDADQHDHADERVDVQIHPEQDQRDQRAEAGRRQTGENRQRVDVALVENAEHDVDDHDRDDEQDREIAERALERLGRALELAADAFGQRRRRPPRRTRRQHGAERRARREAERDRHRRQLAVVVDGLRTDRLAWRAPACRAGRPRRSTPPSALPPTGCRAAAAARRRRPLPPRPLASASP